MMLVVTKLNKQKMINLVQGQTVKIPADNHTQYQLFNKQGKIIKQPKVKKINKDLLVFNDDNFSEIPDIIIENYYEHFPIENQQFLIDSNLTFATLSESTVLPMVVGDNLTTATMGKLLAGSMMIGGVATASNKNNHSVEKIKNNDMAVSNIEKPVITFNNITTDDVIDFNEAKATHQTITGKVSHANNGDEIRLTVGNEKFITQVNGGVFSQDIPTSVLTTNTTISAQISTTDSAGNSETATKNHTYSVDLTELSAKITINPIDTINKAKVTEMVEITGNLELSTNVKTTDVIVSVNGTDYTASISGTVWRVTISGDNLAYKQDNADISAKVIAKDSAGNTYQHTHNGRYFVDTVLDKPEISFDKITQDDILNIVESQQTQTPITGTVKNAKNGDIVSLKIGLVEFTGEVQNGTFNIPVDTKTLVLHKEVHASITTTDTAGNRETGTNTHTITVDDMPPPTPNITINDITNDNVVNADEAKGNITISGKVGNVAVNSPITVSCGCTSCGTTKWVDLPAIVREGGIFEVVFDGAVVANADTIKVSATNNDDAGNTNSAETSKTYNVDTIPPDATLTIDNVANDNIINIQEAQSVKTTLAGSLGNLQTGDTVKSLVLMINNVEYLANVIGNRYTVDVETAHLTANNVVTATAIVIDKAGNEQILTQSKSYSIDVNAPIVNIEILSIAENDVVNLTEFGNQVVITGKVTGEFNVGDTVKIGFANKMTTVVLDNLNGEFSVHVSADDLKNSVDKQIHASISTTDKAGNVSETATASKTYTVEKPPADIQIALQKISGDNLINVSEATQEVTVTGVVSGKDRLTTGETVELLLNGQVIKSDITVQSNGIFTTKISGQNLVNSQGHTLTAKVVGQDNAVATGSLQYNVDADASAKVDITKVTNHGSLSVGQSVNLVYIDGVATFADRHQDAKNAQLVRTVEVVIGEKTYSAGVRNGKFSLAIPESELKVLNGQALNYTFKAEPWGFVNGKAQGLSQQVKGYIEVSTTSLEIHSPHIIKENGKDIVKVAEHTSTISGVVSGVAKVDDVIHVHVNDKTYVTHVLADKTFNVSVLTSDLQSDKDNVISATLATTDLSNKQIEVGDYELFTSSSQQSQTFVSGHTQAVVPDEYFINKLGITSDKYPGFELGVYGVPVGGNTNSTTLKFYFGTKADYDSFSQNEKNAVIGDDGKQIADVNTIKPFLDPLKEIVRNAYKQIASYTNVEFVEATNIHEADLKLFYADFAPNTASAFAYNGGALWWDATAPVNDYTFTHNVYTALHEISHNLNMTHTHEGFFNNHKLEDSPEFSYMSYRSYVNNLAFQDLQNLRMYDLAFLHYQLGVDKNARAGNDVYGFKEYNMYKDDADRYIWDGNGVDTFDASNATAGVNVNLTPGSWAFVGSQSELFAVASQTLHKNQNTSETFFNQAYTENTYTQGQAFIGYGTQIENLMGSAHNDTLTGNKADNQISGGAGDDTIDGGLGNDYLDGGTGADTLTGGVGNDTYVIDNGKDKIIENDREGNDLVYSTINYTLPQHVENITLLGDMANLAVGNGLNNTLTANNVGVTLQGLAGNDILMGGLGADTLSGGAGNDVFVFNTGFNGTIDTILDFNNGDTIALSADVFKGLTVGNTANLKDHIKYDETTKTLSYDEDNEGNIDAIAFAKVEGDFRFDVNKFNII